MPDMDWSEWHSSPAHIFLLAEFLEARSRRDLTPSIDWQLVLGESPQMIIERFLATGVLEFADKGLELAERMKVLRVHELRVLSKDLNLTVSGKKDQIISRLIKADPESMKEVARQRSLLRCTPQGQAAVNAFLTASDRPASGNGLGSGDQPTSATELAAPVADSQHSAHLSVKKPEPEEEIAGTEPMTWLTQHHRPDDDTADEEAATEDADRSGIDLEATREHVELGRYHGSQGTYDLALAELDKATDINPRYAEAYFWRGVIFERVGDFTRSLAEVNKAIALNPNPAEYYACRGDAYRGLGQPRLAVYEYNLAIQQNPEFLMAFHNRGVAYEQLGEYDKALADYNRAVELNPHLPEPYYGRGAALEKIGEIGQAMNEFEMVIQLSHDTELIHQAQVRLDLLLEYV